MKLTSPAFEDGEKMPERHGYIRENVNPELHISEVPENAEAFALIMDDPDAVEPAGKIWLHWTLWNIPADTEKIGEGEAPGIEGTTDFRKTGYGGPNPPDGEHTYVFRLYALDKELGLAEGASREELGLAEGASREELEEAMDDHIIDKAKLKGRYEPVE